jgi:hypothetical protein
VAWFCSDSADECLSSALQLLLRMSEEETQGHLPAATLERANTRSTGSGNQGADQRGTRNKSTYVENMEEVQKRSTCAAATWVN